MTGSRKTESTWGSDLPAGLVVFLVALPLCLGIATASGATPLAGIIAGALGGILVGAISKSPLSVSGPAAGLVAIVLTALESLKGAANPYQAFQVALIIAGGLQILMGLLRLGAIANFVPNSVIKGMLAGIGVVIILKQIPHALGWDKEYEGDFGFVSKFGNTFTDIAKAVMSITPTALVIFLIGVAIIYFWDSKPMKSQAWTKFVPGPLVAVIVGAIVNTVLVGSQPAIALRVEDLHLVKLPGTSELTSALTFPDWTAVSMPAVWITAGILAVVASLETLLSIDAADKLDDQRRATPTNRELVAQGIGNGVSGLLGGLPLTSVVVRTSANAYSGGKTNKSTIFHGVLLAVAVISIPSVLNTIPLAVLASVLIMVGWKLTKPSVIKKVYADGLDQFIPFIITLLGVVFTDLLKGVVFGLLAGLVYVMKANHHKSFTLVHEGKLWLLRFNKDITFTNKVGLRNTLDQIPDNVTLVINGTKADFVDHDILEMVKDFAESGKYRGIAVEMTDVEDKTWFINMRKHRQYLKDINNG
jgi:MFS superfamily sulfate permease-like transporter